MQLTIVDKRSGTAVAWLTVDSDEEAQKVFDAFVEANGGDRGGWFYIVA